MISRARQLAHTAKPRTLRRRRELPPHQRHAKRSYSQIGEDLIVRFVFDAIGVPCPSYLDIGAYDPFHLSNTAIFYQSGSRGINIEPNPDSFGSFLRHRPEDINLNVGCADLPGRLTYYALSAPALNTFSAEAAEAAVATNQSLTIAFTREIDVRTVAEVLERNDQRCPDFLSLDVEGFDLPILRTLPTWPGRPTVICVETITYSENGHGVKIPEISDLLTGHGYMSFADTRANTIFVLRDRWVR